MLLLLTVLIGIPMLSESPAFAQPASKLVCPARNSSRKGDAPVLILKTVGEKTLLVCGQKRSQGKTKTYLSDLQILDVEPNGKTEIIKSTDSISTYRVWPKDHQLMIEELAWFSGGWTPVFRSEVSCTEDSCSESEKKCCFDKEAAIKHQAQRELKTTDSNGRNPQEPTLMDSVTDAALTGNENALKFFLEPKKNMHLSPEGKERFLETQTLIKRLREAKCL